MKNIKHHFNKTIIRSYDVRGIFNKTLFENDAKVIGQLFGLKIGKNKTLNIGYDGRKSSLALKESLIKGIIESGANVCEIGLVPTPLLYFSCVSNTASGGIMVTGSHNPKEHNGFKFVLGNLPFYGKDLKEIEKLAKNFSFSEGKGQRTKKDFSEKYFLKIFQNFSQKKNLNIVWDSGNGSAGNIMTKLSKRILGKQKLLFNKIDGDFPNHHPDPSDPKNLECCIKEIKKNKFDLGIAFDGDGDRIGVVDDKGRVVPGDILLLLLAKDIIKRKKKSIIIGDVKCSQVLFDEIEKLGAKTIISKTGHSHVKMDMKKYNADLAGEMSGHVFFSENYGFDDGLYASLYLIDILSNSKKKLSSIIDEIPKVFNTPEIRIKCDDEKKFELIQMISRSQKRKNKKIIDIDGLRVLSSQGWWLLRASNTQAELVLRCESNSKKGLAMQIKKVKNAIKEFDPQVSQKILVENKDSFF
ncbi:MAG: phosphomannomutase/phosphoglucomutase [Pseudomonadota bacterium]|nr:phosphomannomutase/phosphoglucomutase [Pseudomonadota bacterium]